MIELFAFLTTVFGIIVAAYCVRLARKLYMVSTNLEAIYSAIGDFRVHVEQVHGSEMFYGDQTLQSLIEHSKYVLDVLDDHKDIMEMVIVEEPEESDAEEEN